MTVPGLLVQKPAIDGIRHRSRGMFQVPQLQPLTAVVDLNYLIKSLILREVQVILLCNLGRHEPSPCVSLPPHDKADLRPSRCLGFHIDVPATDEMTAFEELDQRFGCRQTDQDGWLKRTPQPRLGRSLLDIPRRRCIDRCDWQFCLLERSDHGWEWLPHFARETKACGSRLTWRSLWDASIMRPTENGVDDMVRRLEGNREVIYEGHIEIFKLLRQSLRWYFCQFCF